MAFRFGPGTGAYHWPARLDQRHHENVPDRRASTGPRRDTIRSMKVGMSTIRMADGTTIKASPAGNPPVLVGAGSGRLTVTSRLGSLVVSVA